MPKISEKQLRLMYTDNRMNVTDIAAELGIDRHQVYYLLKEYEIKLTDKKPYTKEEIEEVYINHGVPGGCKILRISPKTFYKLMDQFEIEKKYKKRKVVA